MTNDMSDKTPQKYNNAVALEDRNIVDGRMFSPSAGRNKAVVAANLAELLPQKAKVLEIASGTGVDMCATDWTHSLDRFDALFSANMIHIAPWEAALGLAAGAVDVLTDSGAIWLYGPFLDGAESAPSNLAFDASLKSRNSAWGVRSIDSVKHIFAKHGFNGYSRRDLPKNNLLLGFSR